MASQQRQKHKNEKKYVSPRKPHPTESSTTVILVVDHARNGVIPETNGESDIGIPNEGVEARLSVVVKVYHETRALLLVAQGLPCRGLRASTLPYTSRSCAVVRTTYYRGKKGRLDSLNGFVCASVKNSRQISSSSKKKRPLNSELNDQGAEI